jgi:uncharacterized protein
MTAPKSGTRSTAVIAIDADVLIAARSASDVNHLRAMALMEREFLRHGEEMLLAPSVAAEFLHVVTDSRRFPKALTMDQALLELESWVMSPSTVILGGSKDALLAGMRLMREAKLGRKRVNDTMLAGSLIEFGVKKLMTFNRGDFDLFGYFEIVDA